MKQLFDRMAPYIAKNPYFDLVETKFGYAHIYPRANSDYAFCTFIPDYDHLLLVLIEEVVSDVCDLNLCGEHNGLELYPAEIAETRRRLTPFFRGLDREEHCLAFMEAYFKYPGLWTPV